MPDQVCFPNHKGLPGQPGPPTVDGFVEPDAFIIEPVFGAAPSEVDTGWTQSSRVTYGDATSVGDVRPLMAFQGIKHKSNDLAYLAFVVRRDTSFEDDDMITLVFHPNFATGSVAKTGEERRIDIFPNAGGVGAGDAGGPAGTGTADRRQNRDPRNEEYYRWNTAGAGSWQSMPAPSNIAIKVESWDLGPNLRNWSVEVQLPTTIANGGADWVDFTASFGFYFNVVRICTGVDCTFDPTPFSGLSFQFTWPRNNSGGINRLFDDPGIFDVADYVIPPNWLGEAILGSGAACSGVAGVKFVGGASGIGVRNSAVALAPITNVMHGTNPNYFVARIENDGSVAADNVLATFRIANWGLGPGDVNKWNLVPARAPVTLTVAADPSNPLNSNPTGPNNIPSGGTDHDLVLIWELNAAERALYTVGGSLSSHQCIWVLIDSNQNVDFVQSSVRRNMNFTALSRFEQEAEVSGDGYPEPREGKDHNFILIVSQMRRSRLISKKKPASPDDKLPTVGGTGTNFDNKQIYQDRPGTFGRIIDVLLQWIRSVDVFYEWVWIMDGYRETEQVFASGEKRYRIYQGADSFGYIGEHTGLVSEWKQSVGPTEQDRERFEQVGENSYRLRVPHEGAARINTSLEAVEFRIPLWVWLLLLIIIILIILFIWLL